jgi:pyridoxamine 5'-phosphate oxidase
VLTVRESLESLKYHDPIEQFGVWFDEARATDLLEPEAMTIATATRDGTPSARMVLLKSFDRRGLVFYTNYESRKGNELAENPRAAAVLFWAALRRQIRVEGLVEQVSADESDRYFSTREPGSQLSAWASNQSRVIEDRAVLEAQVEQCRRRFAERSIPRPPHWGGYRLIPRCIEFWQGRPNRMHDRLRYRLIDDMWEVELLAP